MARTILKYRVQVIRHKYDYQSIFVDATSMREAAALALGEALDNPDDFCDESEGKIKVGQIVNVTNKENYR